MTVRALQESQGQTTNSGYQHSTEKKNLLSEGGDWCWNGKPAMMIFTGIGRDQEGSTDSSEDAELNVKAGQRTGNAAFLHHQILKIREEDSRIGEDVADCLSMKIAVLRLALEMDAVLLSREPILPSSPLSGKIVIKQYTNAI